MLKVLSTFLNSCHLICFPLPLLKNIQMMQVILFLLIELFYFLFFWIVTVVNNIQVAELKLLLFYFTGFNCLEKIHKDLIV